MKKRKKKERKSEINDMEMNLDQIRRSVPQRSRYIYDGNIKLNIHN